ncbi:MAG: hypothetical protein ACTSRX_03100, partial [Promethearchaeota archaeon]
IFGIVLIPINLVCLIGAIISRNPYEALWISHYAGLLGAIVLIYKFKKPILNGIYSFLFVFQVGSSIMHIINPVPYVNYLDTFYWLNHVPHLVGIYLIMKKDFDVKGVHFGFISMLLLISLTFQILYINSQESLGINTVYRDYFFYILFFALIWYIFLLFFHYKKKDEM